VPIEQDDEHSRHDYCHDGDRSNARAGRPILDDDFAFFIHDVCLLGRFNLDSSSGKQIEYDQHDDDDQEQVNQAAAEVQREPQ
jgi:hypothetical protein